MAETTGRETGEMLIASARKDFNTRIELVEQSEQEPEIIKGKVREIILLAKALDIKVSYTTEFKRGELTLHK